MFYSQILNNYLWFKSDKDKFWIWPFDKKLEDHQIKQFVKDFKTYKHIGWIWQNKNFVFEQKNNWLNLIYNEFDNFSDKKIDIFVVNKVGKIDFVDESKFLKFFEAENFTIQSISWWFLHLAEEEFVQKLPILNWFINKYWFVHQVNLPINQKLVLLENIYDVDWKVDIQLPDLIKKIQNYLNSDKLLTRSKSQEFYNQLEDEVYKVVKLVVKIFFLIYDTIKNRQQLNQILSSENMLAEYKAQAQLLSHINTPYVEMLLNRLNFLLKQLVLVSDLSRIF